MWILEGFEISSKKSIKNTGVCKEILVYLTYLCNWHTGAVPKAWCLRPPCTPQRRRQRLSRSLGSSFPVCSSPSGCLWDTSPCKALCRRCWNTAGVSWCRDGKSSRIPLAPSRRADRRPQSQHPCQTSQDTEKHRLVCQTSEIWTRRTWKLSFPSVKTELWSLPATK